MKSEEIKARILSILEDSPKGSRAIRLEIGALATPFYRALSTLEEEGFVERKKSGVYHRLEKDYVRPVLPVRRPSDETSALIPDKAEVAKVEEPPKEKPFEESPGIEAEVEKEKLEKQILKFLKKKGPSFRRKIVETFEDGEVVREILVRLVEESKVLVSGDGSDLYYLPSESPDPMQLGLSGYVLEIIRQKGPLSTESVKEECPTVHLKNILDRFLNQGKIKETPEGLVFVHCLPRIHSASPPTMILQVLDYIRDYGPVSEKEIKGRFKGSLVAVKSIELLKRKGKIVESEKGLVIGASSERRLEEDSR